MHVRSALKSFASTIGKKRGDPTDSQGTSSRARALWEAYPESFDGSHSTESLKHTSHSPPEPKVSICSFVRDKFARGLSNVRRPRSRDISRNTAKTVNTDVQRQRLTCLPNVFARRPETISQTSNIEESNQQCHSHSTLPEIPKPRLYRWPMISRRLLV